LKSPVAHWEQREWVKNQDVLALDPQRPQAVPVQSPTDLRGQVRVRLTAEDRHLVAYGFGGQRIAFTREDVGAVHTVDAYRTGRVTRGQALLVLDREQRVLLRASGLWETYGEVKAVCKAAKVKSPTHLTPSYNRSYTRSGRRKSSTRQVPRFRKAPGYRRLRTRPRGTALRVLALIAVFALTAGLGVVIGTLPAVWLPEWFGAVRTLIGIAGGALGLACGLWLGAAVSHLTADAVRWAVISWGVGTLAPPRRFFRRREPSGGWAIARNIALAALVPALIGWGPGVGIASLAHGFRDASLVAELRAHGVTTQGRLIDEQDFEDEDNGDTKVTDVSTLVFQHHEVTDPAIGGRPLPLDPGDPLSTSRPETIVYLPSDPDTAAARQQVAGSVWHGAPTANLISGGLLTLALPPVIWLLVLLNRRRRWRRAKDLVDDLAT
jgi:hypothetical protein